MELVKDIIQIVQGIVIIGATIFTSWWAYKTFAHKESIDELKKIINILEDLYFELFVIQPYYKDFKTGRDLDKFLDLLVALNQTISSVIYLKKADRTSIVNSVQLLIDVSHKIILEKDEGVWKLAEQDFNKQYRELKILVYTIGQKYV